MNSTAPEYDFKGTAAAALAQVDAVLLHWLPDGKHQGHEYRVLNPTRADGKPGSFSNNTTSGQWADFATGDKGGDLISLVAYLDDCNQGEAESRLADFLGLHSKKVVTKVTKVTRNGKNNKNDRLYAVEGVTSKASTAVTTVTLPIPGTAPPPDFTHHKHGEPVKVWTYHTPDGRPHFYICRYDTPDGKEIRPHTWNGKAWQWKSIPAPRPLYNLNKFSELTPTLVDWC